MEDSLPGNLLICASSRNEVPDLVRGHVLCVVELFDITEKGPRDYVWHIRNVRFVEPFPVKGKLHLYDVDDEKIMYLTKGKGLLQKSYNYEEARNHWLALKLIRELTPEENDKYYE